MNLIVKQIKDIIDPNLPLVSNLSNVSSILYTMGNVNWAGFYIVQDDVLYLGPFQGEVACTVISKGKGVCGTCFEKKETIIVDNVHEFKGHIACSSKSNSEIVVPIILEGNVVAVIDIDSPTFSRFSKKEKEGLEEVSKLLSNLFKKPIM